MTGKSPLPATLAAQALGWTDGSSAPDLLRLSVGIEDPADLDAALSTAD